MPIPASKRYPVDICYMVADLKYNARDGVKICEIQQATLSLFNGDTYRNLAAEQSIHNELARTLQTYNKTGWVVEQGIADKKLVDALDAAPTWHRPKDLIALFSDQDFKDASKHSPTDLHDISTYSGLLYTSWAQLSVIYDFEERLPGVVAIDKSSFTVWIDKYRMTRLFAEDARLATIKPKWGNYKKTYKKNLAATIADELGGETFVIKPRGNFLGKGVILVQRKDLDAVVRYIITKKGPLSKRKESAYTAWQYDKFDSFLVEQFITSDPIRLPHMENKRYQPTMRVAFVLAYNKGKHDVHFLGSYWKTPEVSIDDEGDFMEKNKDICEPPYYLAVDDKTMHKVQAKLRATLPILHAKLLDFSPADDEEFFAPGRRGGVEIVLQEQSATA
jgi:hypothetical protein